MDNKQKEALVLELLEKGESYRSIAQRANVSPNTIKKISNRAGLDETTSASSRVFELYSKGKDPLGVSITLGLEADEAIRYHQQYFMLLGCTEFTKVYQRISNDPWPFVKFVKLVLDAGMSEDQVINLLEISKDHLPKVIAEYEKLKAGVNSLEHQISKSAEGYQRLCSGITNSRKTENQLQLTIKELQAKLAKLDLQRERTENFLKQYQEKNVEYNKVKREVERALADRRELLRLAVQSTIELLRLEPQKFLSLHYNRSTIHPGNDEDQVLVDAEQLYEKMAESITNKAVTNLSKNISSVSAFTQSRLYGEQAYHPNFDVIENNLSNTNNAFFNRIMSQLQDDGNDTDVLR